MPFIVIPIFLFLICLFIFGLVLRAILKRRSKRKSDKLSHFIKDVSFLNWNNLAQIDSTFLGKNIDTIYFVHGTFVGDDPWKLISLLENNFSGLSPAILSQIRNRTKRSQNFVAKDYGNFTQEHVEQTKKIVGENVEVKNFTWSSANNHFARVEGAINLLNRLALEGGKRHLLIGHSHAGQVFAVVSQLLNHEAFRNQILMIMKLPIEQVAILQKNIKILNHHKIDFVTMGSPARYEWCINSKRNTLLHIINHRGSNPQAGTFSGVSFTRDGDYIQQWGIAGSDFRSPVTNEDEINNELDTVLGLGSNIQQLSTNIQKRQRLHHTGKHLLINFNDNAGYPNFLLSMFGHGVYTKIELLPKLLGLISSHLEGEK